MDLKTHLETFFSFNANGSSGVFNFWCSHNVFIRGELIQLAAREKRKKNQSISSLLTDIAHLEGLQKSKRRTIREELVKSILIADR